MSGMSLATVIMEAGEKSGALKQADYAFKQGRQVLISATVLKDQQLSWPTKYIQRGAQIVQSPSDVLRKLEEIIFWKVLKKIVDIYENS